MNFTSPSTQKKGMDKEVAGDERKEKKRKKSAQIPKPTEKEIEGFYEKLSKCSSKPAILSITPPYSKKYIPKVLTIDLPVLLSEITDQTIFF